MDMAEKKAGGSTLQRSRTKRASTLLQAALVPEMRQERKKNPHRSPRTRYFLIFSNLQQSQGSPLDANCRHLEANNVKKY